MTTHYAHHQFTPMDSFWTIPTEMFLMTMLHWSTLIVPEMQSRI